MKIQETHTYQKLLIQQAKKKRSYVCLKAHSQGSGGRGGESMGDGSNDSGQIILHCDVRHGVGQVETSVRPARQRKEQS